MEQWTERGGGSECVCKIVLELYFEYLHIEGVGEHGFWSSLALTLAVFSIDPSSSFKKSLYLCCLRSCIKSNKGRHPLKHVPPNFVRLSRETRPACRGSESATGHHHRVEIRESAAESSLYASVRLRLPVAYHPITAQLTGA